MTREELLSLADNAIYRIDKNVPIPARDYGRRGGASARYPWRDMEIGDSFFVPDPVTQDFISGARHYAQRSLGWKFVTRVVEGGIRVWRVAKPPVDDEQDAIRAPASTPTRSQSNAVSQ